MRVGIRLSRGSPPLARTSKVLTTTNSPSISSSRGCALSSSVSGPACPNCWLRFTLQCMEWTVSWVDTSGGGSMTDNPSSSGLTEERATELLGGLSGMLATDGYELAVSIADPDIVVAINALPGACEDCLIPQ